MQHPARDQLIFYGDGHVATVRGDLAVMKKLRYRRIERFARAKLDNPLGIELSTPPMERLSLADVGCQKGEYYSNKSDFRILYTIKTGVH